MMCEVSKDFKFEAAHSLPHLGPDHKCSRLHGHSYGVRVTCRGPVDSRGFVIDYAEIAQAMAPVLGDLDHHNLDDIVKPYSTAEYLAVYLWTRLTEHLPELYSVSIAETSTTWVHYYGE